MHHQVMLVLIVMLAVTACGRNTDGAADKLPGLSADSLGRQTILSNAEHLASEQYSGTDSARGERLAMNCRACHALEAGGNHMLGPALGGFFGQTAGSAEGFAYSTALRSADFRWTPRALDAWLAQPAEFLPGNRMAYAGIRKADDRRALIAYLLSVTDAENKQ